MRLRSLIFFLGVFVGSGVFVTGLSGCDFIKSLTSDGGASGVKKPTTPTQPLAGETTTSTENTPNPTPPAPKCPNGSPPTVVTGDCSGVWGVGRQGKSIVCEFKWGPPISCPSGTKPMGNIQSVCYGTTTRPLAEKQTANTGEKCQEIFGKYPQSPKYELNCCKE